MASRDRHMDPQTFNLYMETFNVFDKDGDGVITRDELKQTFQQMGQRPCEKDMDHMMQKYDKDSTGKIDFNEFVFMLSDMQKLMEEREAELKNAFKIFDYNANGQVCAKAVKDALYSLGDVYNKEEIDEMVRQADDNGDGMINYEEFVRMMTEKGV